MHSHYLIPDQESLCALSTVLLCLEAMAPKTKVFPDRTEGSQEPLSMTGGLEALQDPLTLPCRLMQGLRRLLR